jgi:hypothetical protein
MNALDGKTLNNRSIEIKQYIKKGQPVTALPQATSTYAKPAPVTLDNKR